MTALPGMRGTGHKSGAAHHRAYAPNDDVEDARKLRDRGWSYKEIAEFVERPYWTVVDWCRYKTRTRL